MKFISLVFVLSIAAVMSVLLAAMSSDASAHSAVNGTQRAPAPLTSPLVAGNMPLVAINPSTVNTVSFDPRATKAESPRKNVKKRARAKCARITGNCWGGA